jgi:hypothetical protein
VHERGQKPVDEHQPVLRTRADGPLPRPGRKLGLVPFVPQRAQLCNEFSDHVGRQARDLRLLMIAARDAFPTTRP